MSVSEPTHVAAGRVHGWLGTWSTTVRLWSAPFAAYATIVAIGFVLRSLTPVDETRYATVAWEMWQRGDWLVPHLNGMPYEHKPPLLFWLIHAGWTAFGVNEWWPRLIGPCVTLVNVALLANLANRLWPVRIPVRWLAPVVFLGTWYIAAYSTSLMFDMLLLSFVLGAWTALWDLARRESTGAAVAFGAWVGLGILAKGPVALVYTLPLALALRWWTPGPRWPWSRLAARIGLSLVVAALIPLTWVVAAAQTADGAFLGRLLFDQTLDRVSGTIGHGRPWWWYLQWLPLLLLPWILWPPVWRAWRRCLDAWAEPAVRFALLGIAVPGVILTFVGGKQVHYLIPLLALAALVTARLLANIIDVGRRSENLLIAVVMSPLPLFAIVAIALSRPDLASWVSNWSPACLLLAAPGALLLLLSRRHGPVAATLRVGTVSLAFAACLALNLLLVAGPRYDLTEASRFIARQESAGRAVAMLAGRYQGEFGFLGRLQKPIVVLKAQQVPQWLDSHPDGVLVARSKRLHLPSTLSPAFSQSYKTDQLLIVTSAQATTPGVRFTDSD